MPSAKSAVCRSRSCSASSRSIAARARSASVPRIVSRIDRTASGFVIEFDERWNESGQPWYCREMIRADLIDGAIAEISIYCTGDWDTNKQAQHAATVRLLRP